MTTTVSLSAMRSAFLQITDTEKIRGALQTSVLKKVCLGISDKFQFRLHHWPSLMCLWFLFTLIITYSISVGKKHAYKIFPYVSDTGTYSPESCIFSQLINLGTLIMLLNMYLRYRQVELVSELHDTDCSKLNRTSMWLASIGCLGMSIVANFQKMNMRGIHFFGAVLVLGGGVLYTIYQARISYAFRNLETKPNSCGIARNTVIARIVISATCVILFFILIGFGYASEKDFEGDLIWWTPDDSGYVPHVIATISEWIIILLISLFILSYTKEFKEIKFTGIGFALY
ncbi:DNA damage-regulated autophagy modulator protein 2-like [Photinus pyralis]|uniref:DNA damage-regulated autophagy modulator protein 2-like n=1 Tax=Photinus pyralis TaxID=7054 RepID=UPI001266EF18|nr:DNA damage-regulated autophagy modulator protein 2-like [Photinus pyralis]